MTADLQPVPAHPLRERFDSTQLDPPHRFDAWADAVSASFVPLAADPRTPEGRQRFCGELIAQPLGRAVVSAVGGTTVTVHRTRQQIARADPGHIKLGLQLRGTGVVSQDGRDAALAPGDFAIYDTSRPYRLGFDEAFRMFVVMFPRETLRVGPRHLAALTASRFSGRQGVGRIVSDLLRTMSYQLRADELTANMSLSEAVLDLLTAAMTERTDTAAAPAPPLHRDTQWAAIEAYLSAHLRDRDLTVAKIADAHFMSTRSLQKLFEEHDDTVSGWIRRARLEQSRRDLCDPSHDTELIATVGARWGFADAAAFARAFRGQFGATPREYRAHRQP